MLYIFVKIKFTINNLLNVFFKTQKNKRRTCFFLFNIYFLRGRVGLWGWGYWKGVNELLFLQITWWLKTKGNHDITWQELRTERRHQFFYPKHFAFIFSLLTISNVNMINSPSPIFTFSVSKFKLHALDNHQDLSHEIMLLNLWKQS